MIHNKFINNCKIKYITVHNISLSTEKAMLYIPSHSAHKDAVDQC